MPTRREIFLTGALFAVTAFGCGGDGGGGGGSDGSSSGSGSGDDDTGVVELQIESTDPADGAESVYLDQDIRVVFSMPLDPAMPRDAFTVVGDDGEPAQGRVLADNRTAIFTPARFAPEQTYEVTLGTSIASDDHRLPEPYIFTFTTGLTTSDQNEPPGEDYDPLGPGDVVGLGTQAELALLWTGSTDAHFAVEDPPFNPPPLGNPGVLKGEAKKIDILELQTMAAQKLPVVGQFDDDGWEETLVVTNDPATGPQLTVVDTVDNGEFEEIVTALPFELADSFDAAAGDLDDDGRAELVLAVARADEQIRFYVVEYDPGEEAYVLAEEGMLASMGTVDAEYVRVTTGDVDADRKDEIVFAWHIDDGDQLSSAYYVVHDDLDEGASQLRPFRPIKTEMPWQNLCHESYVEVETADVDGDGADEVLFALTEPKHVSTQLVWFQYREWCDIHDTLLVADNVTTDAPRDLEPVVFPSAGTSEAPEPIGRFAYQRGWVEGEASIWKLMPLLLPADLDGDQTPEVMFHNRLFKFAHNERVDEGSMLLENGWPQVVPEEIIAFGGGSWPADLADGGVTQDAKAAYVDRGVDDLDLKEDIVLLRKDAGSIWVELFDIEPEPQEDGTLLIEYDDVTIGFDRVDTYVTYEGTPRLALPHVDRDSITVEKTGHDVFLGDNVVIAVLAAPPCDEALGQETDACGTQFGQGTTMSWSDGAYVNASAGILFGVKVKPKVPLVFVTLKLAEFEVEVIGGVEGSYQYSSGRTVSEQVSHVAGADNNLVVFESYVYDRYHYTYVVHPDEDQIGDPVTISVPTGHKLLATGLEYYNANNGDQIDIEADVLAVMPGDLDSYPTRAEAQEILDRYTSIAMTSEAVRTPRGDSNSIGIEHGVSTHQSNEFSVGLFVEATGKTCGPEVAGSPQVCGGIATSASAGYAHSYEWGTDLIFAGSVAGLPEGNWAQDAYDVGLFAYEVELEDDALDEIQDFMVVSYFIE